MLGELMRLKWAIAVGGTHGKTTTTSLIATLLDAAGLDPTVINGGIINAYGTNARLGDGDWMVVEADESDGSFTKLPSTIAVVTNIDPEHIDFYGSFEALHDAFETFVENIPFYGFAVLCIDHPVVQATDRRISDRRSSPTAVSPKPMSAPSTYERLDGGHSRFDVVILPTAPWRIAVRNATIDVALPMLGEHNVQNCARRRSPSPRKWASPTTVDRAGLAQGFRRGQAALHQDRRVVDGITVIDDYGHHPVEIAAVLQGRARRAGADGKVIAVVQPHRYSRWPTCSRNSAPASTTPTTVIVADVYPAGEEPIESADRDALVGGMRARGHRDVTALTDVGLLAPLVSELAQPGDLVVCLGAGSITAWANALPGELEEVYAAKDAQTAQATGAG